MNNKLIFTEAEDRFIIENYSLLTAKEIAGILHKVEGQIRRRVSFLKLKKDTGFTQEETQYIIDNYANMDTDKIAQKLNKTRKQIMSCASHNKINKIKITIEQRQYIIENYSNTPTEKMEKVIGLSKSKIKYYADKMGLNKEIYRYFSEEEKEYILKNYNILSNTEIAKNIGNVTVKQITAFGWHHGLLRDIKYYSVDEKYFDVINNEHKAYWLGFLYADGSVVERYNNSGNLKSLTLSLELKSDDKPHIKKFNYDLQSDYLITDRLTNDNHPASKVSISNTNLCRSLIEKGCVPRKSLVLTFPNGDILPKNLIHHFIRGYFDGDGCISIGKTRHRYTVSLVGTWDFLTTIQNIVSEELGLFKPKFFSCGQAYTSSWSSKYDVQKWYDYLYKDATVYLDRKYERFQIFINDYKN